MRDPLDETRRAYLGARAALAESQRAGNTPDEEGYADAVLALLDALSAGDAHREVLEVIGDAMGDGVRGPLRDELIERRTEAKKALTARGPAPAAAEVPRRYAHPKFGVGVEVGGDAKSARLRFDDGTERTILRVKLTEA